MNKEKNKKYLIYLIMLIAIITGPTVNPIQKGISVLTEKPVAKEIQKIVDENESQNLWIADNTEFYMSNYLLCNKAKVINSTNTYPNFELFETVLGEKALDQDTRKIYNRYAHIVCEITENKNDVELVYEDRIKLYIVPEKLAELGVKYIFTTRDIDEFDTESLDFSKLYDEQGLKIYELNNI